MEQIESVNDPGYYPILGKLQKFKASRLHVSGKPHYCSHAYCNPECGGFSNVYLCDYGTVHVCSVGECEIYPHQTDQTCTISGIQYGGRVTSYNRNDSRTWRNVNDGIAPASAVERKKVKGKSVSIVSPPTGGKRSKKPIAERFTDTTILNHSRELVILLLFSSSRQQCNDSVRAENESQAKRAKLAYITQRRDDMHQLPFLTDMYRVTAHYTSLPLPLEEIEQDEGRINYYAHVILQIWHLVLAHAPPSIIPPKLVPNIIGLGTLYSMRNGIIIEGQTLLPHDLYLESYLPPIQYLSFFDVEKSIVTKGTTLIQETYRHALHQNDIGPERLILDVTKLPSLDAVEKLAKLGKNT